MAYYCSQILICVTDFFFEEKLIILFVYLKATFARKQCTERNLRVVIKGVEEGGGGGRGGRREGGKRGLPVVSSFWVAPSSWEASERKKKKNKKQGKPDETKMGA